MESKFLVLDGGLGTELSKLGFDIDDDPLWSARVLADNPDAVKQVHKSFLESGADVIITASYQASIDGFCSNLGMTPQEAQKLIQKSVRLARETCDEFWEAENRDQTKVSKRLRPIVAGSVGPFGACLYDGSEYTGRYIDHMSVEELKTWHRPRMAALVDAGVDLLALETIPAQKEAEALASLLQEFPSTKAWLTFCCKDGQNTSHGEQLSSAVLSTLSISKQIVAVGVNCCSPMYVKPLLQSLQDKVTLPLVAYPNSGEECINNRWHDTGNVGNIADCVSDWISIGTRWIGGCCRSSPSDISTIRHVVDLESKR